MNWSDNCYILFNQMLAVIENRYFYRGLDNSGWKENTHNGNMVTYVRIAHEQAEELRVQHDHDNYIRLVYRRGQLFMPATTRYDINVNMMVFYRHIEELIGCNDDYCMRKVFHNMDMESALGKLE